MVLAIILVITVILVVLLFHLCVAAVVLLVRCLVVAVTMLLPLLLLRFRSFLRGLMIAKFFGFRCISSAQYEFESGLQSPASGVCFRVGLLISG